VFDVLMFSVFPVGTLILAVGLMLLNRRKRLVPLFAGINEMIAAMRAKDPTLYDKVGGMNVDRAWRTWREVYPEDFPDGGSSLPGAHCIVPKR
jgi:hypothetical protein